MASAGTDIYLAKILLTEGKLVAIPTETVYGLAGNALDEEAALAIFKAKNRPSFDPLIIHISSSHELKKWVTEVPEDAQKLADAFWPGPLTLLLPKKNIIPDIITSGLPEVAVRVPDHPLTASLLRQLEFPLAAPSANPFGYISPTTADHVNQQLGDKIAYILDGGPCDVGVESTIIGFPAGVATLYRKGGLALEDIVKVIGKIETLPHSTSNPKAPGMLKSHYAPRKPFYLKTREEMLLADPSKTAFLLFGKPLDEFAPEKQLLLTTSNNLSEAARNLFGFLRQLDTTEDSSQIYAELVPEVGLGLAINDRLRRAAAEQS
jgi:L-threonylcarbamoyladenylate synthase